MNQLSDIVIDFQIDKTETEIQIKKQEQEQRVRAGLKPLKRANDLIEKLIEEKSILEKKVLNYPQNIQRIQDLRNIKNKNETQKNELKKLEKNNKITPKDFFDKIHLSCASASSRVNSVNLPVNKNVLPAIVVVFAIFFVTIIY